MNTGGKYKGSTNNLHEIECCIEAAADDQLEDGDLNLKGAKILIDDDDDDGGILFPVRSRFIYDFLC